MSFQSITTKYHGPVGRLGARISATASAWGQATGSTKRKLRIVRSYDHAASNQQCHLEVAAELAQELRWDGEWHCGASRYPNNGYVFVRETEFSEDSFDIR